MNATKRTVESQLGCHFKSLGDLARAQAEGDGVMTDHYKMMAADEFAMTVTQCLQGLGNLTGPFLRSRTAMLLSDASIDPTPIAETVLSLFQSASEACDACIMLSDTASAWGHPLKCAGEILSARADIDAKMTEIKEKWPLNDPDMMDLSRRNHECGNAKNAEDVFNAIYADGAGKS